MFRAGADDHAREHAVDAPGVPPGVARAVLNDAVTGFEAPRRSVVELEVDFAGEDEQVIDRLRSVHARVVCLH